ncbi:MAG: hypothetical protein ACYC46_05955 [Acidobacteriaceae bacterium]
MLKFASPRIHLAQALSVLLLCALTLPQSRAEQLHDQKPAAAPAAPLSLRDGFNHMYDLDFAGAHRIFNQWQQLHPEDPMGPDCQAAAYLFSEFARLGVLETQLFTDDDRFDARSKLTPDPAVKTAFMAALDQADQKAARILSHNPSDANAQFAEALADGLHSDYAAMIDKSDLTSLSYSKRGRILAEHLLREHPEFYDAYLAVGVENYLSGIEPAPVRWLLRLGGVETDKQQGIRELQLVAEHKGLLAPFARLMLAVAALRDEQTQKAVALLGGLAAEYPGNPLYARELAKYK